MALATLAELLEHSLHHQTEQRSSSGGLSLAPGAQRKSSANGGMLLNTTFTLQGLGEWPNELWNLGVTGVNVNHTHQGYFK